MRNDLAQVFHLAGQIAGRALGGQQTLLQLGETTGVALLECVERRAPVRGWRIIFGDGFRLTDGFLLERFSRTTGLGAAMTGRIVGRTRWGIHAASLA